MWMKVLRLQGGLQVGYIACAAPGDEKEGGSEEFSKREHGIQCTEKALAHPGKEVVQSVS